MRSIEILLVGCLLLNAMTGYGLPSTQSPQAEALPCEFQVTQAGSLHVVGPVERSESISSFYDYYSASAHTPYVEGFVSVLYLYMDTSGDRLYFVFHFNIDASGSVDGEVDRSPPPRASAAMGSRPA